MYQRKLVGIFILFVTSVGDRCLGSSWPFDGYESVDYTDYTDTRSSWSCDTENQNALAEIKSEIQNLKQLVVGLRQKLDPDFKVEPPVEAESKCPSGFEYVQQVSSCYKVVYEALDWTSADQRCHDIHPGAHLVAITTSDENIGLTAYLRKDHAKNRHKRIRQPWGEVGAWFWSSGQRLNETSCTDEFVWKISNNTQLPLSFTFWNRDEPNCFRNPIGLPVEGCLQIRPETGFKWNDVPCDIVLYPLCEYDPL